LPRIEERWGKVNPPPTRKIPVMIGGAGERKTLRMVAEHADIWHVFGTREALAHKSAVLDRWCAEVGRDPSQIVRSTGVRSTFTASAGFDPTAPDALHDLGFRLFTIGLSGPRYDLSALPRWLEWRDAKNAS